MYSRDSEIAACSTFQLLKGVDSEVIVNFVLPFKSSDFHVMSRSFAAATGLLCFALGFWARKTVERRSERH